MILSANPLRRVCGAVCPDYFCQQACARRLFDRPIEIPAVQAAIVARAQSIGLPAPRPVRRGGKHVAISAPGPPAWGAASVLAQRGYRVTVFDSRRNPAA